MADKLPYFPFFPDDWLSDEKLGLCSLAAQGLWIKLLCLMHKCDRRGFLQQANRKPFSQEQIARFAGCSPDEAGNLLQELIDSGAASVSEHGIVFNRRMVRDEHIRQVRSQAGGKGGKVTGDLLKQIPKQNSSKHPSKSQANYGDGIGNGNGLSKERKGGVGERKEDLFPVFWEHYPKKVAKEDAKKAWKKLNPDMDLLKQMLEALEWQKDLPDWVKDHRHYAPHPATWLNGKRWEDKKPEVTGASYDALFAGIKDIPT